MKSEPQSLDIMPDRSVNLQSVDAMFATLLNETMQIKTVTYETRDIVERNERRVSALEQEAVSLRGRLVGGVAVMSFIIGAIGFAVQNGLYKLFLTR